MLCNNNNHNKTHRECLARAANGRHRPGKYMQTNPLHVLVRVRSGPPTRQNVGRTDRKRTAESKTDGIAQRLKPVSGWEQRTDQTGAAGRGRSAGDPARAAVQPPLPPLPRTERLDNNLKNTSYSEMRSLAPFVKNAGTTSSASISASHATR